jgi:RNA polymerase sigma-70 factor (ECF subfamily)
MDDDALVELFWQRSEDALSIATDRFGAYCWRIADNILHSARDAEECVNDTWLKAWGAIPPARPNRLCAFLGKITRNLALDRYEAAHAQKRGGTIEAALEELAEIPAPELADDDAIIRAINAFLYSEPTEHADIFIKRYWYLASVREIAAEYGYGEGKVASRLFRMRTRLKARLESEGLL